MLAAALSVEYFPVLQETDRTSDTRAIDDMLKMGGAAMEECFVEEGHDGIWQGYGGNELCLVAKLEDYTAVNSANEVDFEIAVAGHHYSS